MSMYAGSSLDTVPDTGGSVRVAIPATPFQIQANSGTSLPCKQVWIIADSANTGNCRVRIGAACTATTGEPVPEYGTHHYRLWIPLDDVSKLFFIGSVENDKVDIAYTC